MVYGMVDNGVACKRKTGVKNKNTDHHTNSVLKKKKKRKIQLPLYSLYKKTILFLLQYLNLEAKR